jgi:hypothetical protein
MPMRAVIGLYSLIGSYSDERCRPGHHSVLLNRRISHAFIVTCCWSQIARRRDTKQRGDPLRARVAASRSPKAAFVTRLQPRRLPVQAARQLPDLLTSLWLPPLAIRTVEAHKNRSAVPPSCVCRGTGNTAHR